MEDKIKYLSEDREGRILNVFLDQKLKYNLDELPTSKIQGLTGVNAYVCAEILSEMEKQGKILKSRAIGKKVYWRLP